MRPDDPKLREAYGNDDIVIPTVVDINIHVDPREIEVRHYPPPTHAKPFTTISFGSVRNKASIFVNDKASARAIVDAVLPIIRGDWPDEDSDS